jgi:hypothetical protein
MFEEPQRIWYPRSRRALHDLTPEAYAITLYDPQFAIWASLLQHGRNPSYVRDHACFVLAFEPQHDDAGVLSSQTVSASKPHSRSVAAASAGRFSSVLILTRSARAEETWCLPGPIRQHRKGMRQCPRASMRVAGKDLGAANPGRDIVEDHRDHDSGPANACLAVANRGIHAHPISPVLHERHFTPVWTGQETDLCQIRPPQVGFTSRSTWP